MRLYRVIVRVLDLDAASRFYASLLDDPGERVTSGRHYFDCGGTILQRVARRVVRPRGGRPRRWTGAPPAA